jgi:hypothetical protein
MFRLLLGLATAGCVVASTGSAQAQALASPDQIRAAFAGKIAFITHRNGDKQEAYFEADGKARVTQKSGTKGDDTYQLQSTDFKWAPTYKLVAGNPQKL